MAIGKMPRGSMVQRPDHRPEAPLQHGNRLGSGTVEEARTRQGPTTPSTTRFPGWPKAASIMAMWSGRGQPTNAP